MLILANNELEGLRDVSTHQQQLSDEENFSLGQHRGEGLVHCGELKVKMQQSKSVRIDYELGSNDSDGELEPSASFLCIYKMKSTLTMPMLVVPFR